MNQENMEDDISDIQRAVARLSEKLKVVLTKASELEKDVRQVSDFRVHADVKIGSMESEVGRISKELLEMDRRLRIFELNHDNRKERWNMIVNFVVQLAWVSMAAILLTKLGLQAPL